MVDSKAWLQHSGQSNRLFALKEMTAHEFGPYDYDETQGEGCECRACEGIVDKPSQVLPVRDFYWNWERRKESINLNDEFYLLCRPVVRGYALNERKWGMHDTN